MTTTEINQLADTKNTLNTIIDNNINTLSIEWDKIKVANENVKITKMNLYLTTYNEVLEYSELIKQDANHEQHAFKIASEVLKSKMEILDDKKDNKKITVLGTLKYVFDNHIKLVTRKANALKDNPKKGIKKGDELTFNLNVGIINKLYKLEISKSQCNKALDKFDNTLKNNDDYIKALRTSIDLKESEILAKNKEISTKAGFTKKGLTLNEKAINAMIAVLKNELKLTK